MAAVLLAAALASGCAELPTASPSTQSAAGRECYARIDISGRFSAQYRKGDRDESVHGHFYWQQSSATLRVNLLTPLGQSLAAIDINEGSASLTLAGQATRTAADADALATAALGWTLPVVGLRDWLQACRPDAAGRSMALPPGADRIDQDGWHIVYPVWESDGIRNRPKRIDLERAGHGTLQAIRMRIVIDEWRPHQ